MHISFAKVENKCSVTHIQRPNVPDFKTSCHHINGRRCFCCCSEGFIASLSDLAAVARGSPLSVWFGEA